MTSASVEEASSAFQAYNEEFRTQLLALHNSDSENDDPVSRDAIGQCNELIKLMAVQARSVDDEDLKRDWLTHVNVCKSQLTVLSQERARTFLLPSESSVAQQADYARKTDQDKQVQQQNNKLERARRTMQEAEEAAAGINEQLIVNRETILHTKGSVDELLGLVGRAGGILRRMTKWT
jgi:hypothetical protein